MNPTTLSWYVQRDQKETIARKQTKKNWLKRRLSPESKPVKKQVTCLQSSSSVNKKRAPYFNFYNLVFTCIIETTIFDYFYRNILGTKC